MHLQTPRILAVRDMLHMLLVINSFGSIDPQIHRMCSFVHPITVRSSAKALSLRNLSASGSIRPLHTVSCPIAHPFVTTLTRYTAYHRSRSSRTDPRIVVHRAVDFLVSRDLFNTDCGRCLIVTPSDFTRSDYNDCALSTEPGHQILFRLCHNHASSAQWIAVLPLFGMPLKRQPNTTIPDHCSARLL